MKKRLISLALVLLMVLSLMPVTAMAATEAKPDKITLVGSDTPLTITKTGTMDYYSWTATLPVYEVAVPAGTTTAQLYGEVYMDASAGSGYVEESTIENFPSMERWSAATIGSSSPYTVQTRINGEAKNMLLVMTQYGVTDTNAYLLRFVEQKAPSATPTITTDLSTDAVSYTYGDSAAALSVAASSTAGTLSYQWQVSTTSAADGFADIAEATGSTYTPSTGEVGSFWYRVVVSNTESGKSASSVTSAVTPVTVTAPDGKAHVEITTSIGYRTTEPMTFALKDGEGNPVTLTADTTSGYAVYDLWLTPGTYTYEAKTYDNAYLLGNGSLTVTDSNELQTFERYLVYVYAQMSGWSGSDFTTEVKDSSGAVMTPSQAYKFASYVAYPYLLAPGRYTYQITPSKAKAAEGYQATAASSKTLIARKTSDTWSAKMSQLVATSFTVPKGATVTVTTVPSKPYTSGTAVSVTADTDGEQDIYTADLTAGSSYIYRASGAGVVTNTGVIKASATSKSYDLTGTMTGSAKAIDRSETASAADIRLSGVDHTGSLALAVDGTTQLTPLRMWQIANNSTPTSKTAYTLEPDFHYTVVDLNGTDVISVDDSGKITAKHAGTALVLVTYDALYVSDCDWDINKNKTFSAIWPENTGVVVVEVGENASSGPSANMTIHSGTKKVAGSKLDAENDVLYYLDGQSCQYTFTPEADSTVTLLRPQLSETAMTYTGSFGTEGVQTAESGAVTLTLTEGKNIVKISKDGADTYQVITAKKATVEITNVSHPGDDIYPGDTVKIQLKGVYQPANYMAYLANLFGAVSYQDPGSSKTVQGTSDGYTRTNFDTADGSAHRAITITIPESWNTEQNYTLTGGSIMLWGNGKDIGSYRSGLNSLSSSVPYVQVNSKFPLGRLPDITIPVSSLSYGQVSFSVKDDSNQPVSDATVTLTSSDYQTKTWTTGTEGSVSERLPNSTWNYTITKAGYQPVSGTVTVNSDTQSPSVTLNKVTGIIIATKPTTTTYIEGDTLNTAGLVVKATTASGSFTLNKADYTVSPTLLNTANDAQTITVSYAGFTAAFTVKVVENKPTIETTLKDNLQQKNSRLTFDVFAKDYFGNKVDVSKVTVKLNGTPVTYNWDDSVKTSYTLKFTQEGENTVTVTAGKTTKTYTIHYTRVAPGESVGQAVVSVEAFTLGGGYIIAPTTVDILEGENAAQMLVRLIEENGLEYGKTGTVESGFYLSYLKGECLSEIDVTGDSIPADLRAELEKRNITISERDDENKLGEFDYASGSGWMFCRNNVFPNVGFADTYLSDDDVIRVQFTLAIGADIGGGWATGGGTGNYLTIADKDALTALLAEVGAGNAPDATSVAAKLYATQTEVDAAVTKLKNDMQAAKPVEDLIAAVGTVSLDSKADIEAAETAYNALADDQQKRLVKNEPALRTARKTYNKLAANAVKDFIDAIGDVTLESKTAIEAAETAYGNLTPEQKALVENYATLTAARAAYEKLVADHAAADAVMVKIAAIGKVTLNSKTAIRAAREAYEALTAEQQALVTNYQVLVQAERTYRQLVAAVSTAIAGGAAEAKAQFPFTDVAESAWYYDEVKNAWENGLIDGMNATEYRPDSTLTVAQAIKLAAALHQMDNDGKVTLKNGAANWYDTYVDYAVYNGIIESKYASYTLAQMNAAISRAEFVHIFHGAMTGYYACNQVADNAIPDVKSGDAYAAEIYEFYRAGILTGSDGKGTFNPASQIKRSEVAAILIRMYDTNARQSISLG